MVFVRSVLSLYAGICLLRVGPERMPTFGPFVVTVVLVTLITEVAALLLSWPHVTLGVALGATLVEITTIAGCIWGLLMAHGTPGRFAATITAVLGCNVMMTLLQFALLPLMSVLPIPLGQVLASVLLVWNLAIFAFILHRALDVGMFSAMLIAFGILMMAFTLMVLTNPMLLPPAAPAA